MNSRERFLNAAQCRSVDRPPVWIMRQAGRYLPEYRALKEKHGFLEMVKTPELAAEVTLQPLKRFPLDAAILFSDILIVPEALGQPYDFRDGGGIEMAYALNGQEAFDKLDLDGFEERLGYVKGAMELTRKQLGEEMALLGFAGSPWTLATYMVEGGSSKDYAKIKTLAYANPQLLFQLLEKLTDAVARLLNLMIEAGADSVQIFDSWASACPASVYWDWSLHWIAKVIEKLPRSIPVIVYAKGMAHHTVALALTGASVLGVDWTVELADIRKACTGSVALQGNLDPAILNTDPHLVREESLKLLRAMQPHKGYIFNLGHGILPTAKVENMEALVNAVVEFS